MVIFHQQFPFPSQNTMPSQKMCISKYTAPADTLRTPFEWRLWINIVLILGRTKLIQLHSDYVHSARWRKLIFPTTFMHVQSAVSVWRPQSFRFSCNPKIFSFVHLSAYLEWNLSSDKYRLVYFICSGILSWLVAGELDGWPGWQNGVSFAKVIMHKHYSRCHLNEYVSQMERGKKTRVKGWADA